MLDESGALCFAALMAKTKPLTPAAKISPQRAKRRSRANGESRIDVAASKLRAMSLAAAPGALLGSEEEIVAGLGVARVTTRQVARLLEREGLILVRRGQRGGYFAARPDAHTIEMAVSAYLDTLDMEPADVTAVASVLWVEAVRKAASLRTLTARTVAIDLRTRLLAIRDKASFDEVRKFEVDSHDAVFDLTSGRYIQLIFQINAVFASKKLTPASESDDTAAHKEFVEAWRPAKLMEISAIADGDPELGMMAARRVRALWQRRIWGAAPRFRKSRQ